MSARRVLRAGGLWFDGKSSRVVVPVSSSLSNFTEKSVAFWVRPSAYLPVWEPYDHGYWASPFGDLFQNIYSALVYYLKNTGGTVVWLRYDLPVGLRYKWIHVATSWDGSTAQLYVNAVKRAEAAFSGVLACSAYNLTLGSRYNGASPFA
ncbi:MAG: LamG-like jellyroll fold domain-containing protein, partial [Thermosphaera sp.]